MSPDFSIGFGKTIFNTSVALLPLSDFQEVEVVLTERLTRVKNSGAWPELPLKALLPQFQAKNFLISENRDVKTAKEFEEYYDSRIPFKHRLSQLGLLPFTSGEGVQTISHHLAHAYSSILFSPFTTCLVLILDGAGSPADENKKSYEYLSLYKWDGSHFELLDKKYLEFLPSKIPSQTFSEGIGTFYEKSSEYIFNSKTEAGKVMGLAPFGKSSGIKDSYFEFLEQLDWKKQYKGKSKLEWENSSSMKVYQDLAATVQDNFEYFVMNYMDEIKRRWPEEENLVFAGGCALNCTFNGKLYQKKIFKNIFIPPNPGDEGIGLGCAFAALADSPEIKLWKPTPWDEVSSSRGLKASVPDSSEIEKTFSGWNIQKPQNLTRHVAELLSKGEVIAWFQGRSECGPRALGNRSILASPKRENLKNYLNENIKFRESFRPYGCTVQWEKSHLYFEVEEGFENPFMSFAVKVKPEYKNTLQDLSHIDGTSRMQTLHRKQNPEYYDLLEEVEKLTGLPILLNTSLNVMNEPILENVHDAKRFMENSKVEVLVIQSYVIRKK